MWKEGYYVKELINSYLSSVKKAEEEDQSEIPKWPSWEMNNHEQVVEGKQPQNLLTILSIYFLQDNCTDIYIIFIAGLEYGRIFDDIHDVVMMLTLLLPGKFDF